MADWYVSSVVHATIATWAASTAYTVGQLIRPTTPSAFQYFVFRCTTAGTTSGTEPNWATPTANNATVTNGTAVFTNITGQSAYGWSAPAGTLVTITAYLTGGRALAGDRIFLSSDHSEATNATSVFFNQQTHASGLIQILSVNRAGSVPPIAADLQSGAAYSVSGAINIVIDAYCNLFWQGVTIRSNGGFAFNSSGSKSQYFKNCAFVFTTSSTARLASGPPCEVTLDNTTVEFGHVGQAIGGSGSSGAFDFTWINTPSAIQGAIVPTALFNTSVDQTSIVCRGVDLSAVTTMLLNTPAAAVSTKVLLDSCRIASGVTRYTLASILSPVFDEIELVNCYDGTNVINERHTAVGWVVSDTGVVMSGGAQDDLSAFSHKLVAFLTRSDRSVQPLDSFWIDVTNNVIGSSKTATVEVLAPTSLNNDDIKLLLEYMGTAGGSSLASFVTSGPAVLASPSALASSTASWTQPTNTTWSPVDVVNVTASNNDLTVTTYFTNAGARGLTGLSTGKYYWEYTVGVFSNTTSGFGICTEAALISGALGGVGHAAIRQPGTVLINNVSITTLGVLNANDIVRFAVDLTTRRMWFRLPGQNWNGNVINDPATGVGGYDISMLTGPLYPAFGSGATGQSCTANFGNSAFSGAVPSGFTAGWPRSTVAQKLQVTFTPQKAGRVRGLVRLGKPGATAWVNPQIAIG
jgi:hypothetical protein